MRKALPNSVFAAYAAEARSNASHQGNNRPDCVVLIKRLGNCEQIPSLSSNPDIPNISLKSFLS